MERNGAPKDFKLQPVKPVSLPVSEKARQKELTHYIEMNTQYMHVHVKHYIIGGQAAVQSKVQFFV